MLIGVQAWSTPFPYRLGDRIPHGLDARTDFEVVDAIETHQRREDVSRRTPFIFRHNPEHIAGLVEQFRSSLGAIVEADTIADLPQSVQDAFDLHPAEATDVGNNEEQPESENAEYQFSLLKEVVQPRDDRPMETQVSMVVDEFTRLLADVRQTGVIDTRDIRQRDIGLNAQLAIFPLETPLTTENPLEQTDDYLTVQLADVNLSDQLNDAGLIGQRWSDYPNIDPIRNPTSTWLRNRVRPSLRYDQSATQAARKFALSEVEEVVDTINQDDELVPPNGVINSVTLPTLIAESQALAMQTGWWQSAVRGLTVFILLSVLAVLHTLYMVSYEQTVLSSFNRLTVYLAALVIAVTLGRLFSFDPLQGEIFIVVATTMIFCVAYSQAFALLTVFTLSLIVTLSTRLDVIQFVVLVASSAAAVLTLKRVNSRSTLIMSGIAATITCLLVMTGLEVCQAGRLEDVFIGDGSLIKSMIRTGGWCLAAGFLVAGALPAIESMFGIVTGISLLEMSTPSHPLLQELVHKAPGTYNHSMAVATIAEAAAEAIGANALLVRVGAYFHDIGKIPKAEYFVENMLSGEASRHDRLAPAMSTLIIIGHVKDGVDMANRFNLPQPLIDFIEQHHGTTLVEYFYHAASKRADEEPDRKQDVEESAFRYPGPKPNTRETAILMLADAVESASRALSEPTPARIESLVHSITMKRLLDGQFDDSPLKLSEIRIIETTLCKSLISMHHGRIAYPEAQKAEDQKAKSKLEDSAVLKAAGESSKNGSKNPSTEATHTSEPVSSGSSNS